MMDDLGTGDLSSQQTREPGNLYGPRSRLKDYWQFTREQNVRVKAIEAKFNLPRITEAEMPGRKEKSKHDRQIGKREDASPSVCGADLGRRTDRSLGAATSRLDQLRSDEPTETVAGADEKELSTAAKRFLVAEINRLVEENRQLKQFKEKYHDVDKKLVALKEMIKPARKNLFLSSVCLIAGSAGVAAAPSVLSISQYSRYVFVGVSAMLLVAGIVARVQSVVGSPSE